MGRLAGNNILITGSNSGIGLAAAQESVRHVEVPGRGCRPWRRAARANARTVRSSYFEPNQ
jgi:NAD(P)-dependent dehydrogenase (short-subunit alcohol dehydrogenase family)